MTIEEREWAIKSFTDVKTNAEAILRDLPLIEESISDEDILNQLSRKSVEEQIRRANAALEALKVQPCENCVSREAVVSLAKDIVIGDYRHRCIDPQSVMELPPVTPKLFDAVINKIRTDIEELKMEDNSHNICFKVHNNVVESVLKIIDKYKTESEE